ncbi:MAG: hypothetical protein LC112_08695 [Flavobacteriales bacterium]|nr:hypothetical protein [Flavobacteriales bacterium]
MKTNLIFLPFLLISMSLSSQTQQKIDFSNFKTKIVKSKKANLKKHKKYQSKYPKDYYYQPDIVQIYKDSEINFGGQYIIIEHGRTNYEISAFMVDSLTGKIYNLPDSENGFAPESILRCTDDPALDYQPNSNLLIINQYFDESGIPLSKKYLWDKNSLKFKLLQTDKINCREIQE